MIRPGPSEAERLARLRLARTDRVGPVSFRELIRRFGDAQRAMEALPGLVRGAPQPFPLARAEAEMAAGRKLGATLVVWGDALYPAMLAALDPPPPLLWTLGDPALLSRSAIGVVGARVASASGQRFARAIAHELGEAGHAIVSGMARGIDAAAHEGALDWGTVAVLGGGVDDVYPSENASLYAAIRDRGCVVSENPPGAQAQARDFPRRNRVIAGLSRGVVVVEAELRSGSLITARLAAEQGRDVFAVPGSPLDPRSRGPNDLLRQGAIVCEGAGDVLRELAPAAEPYPGVAEPDPIPPTLDPGVSAAALALLSPTPVPVDEIVRALSAPPGVVLAALVELSLSGEAELIGGGLVCRGSRA